MGNIAAAVCDLWSNESVQDVRLLGGFAPECFSEMLVYDCRLMNQAARAGHGALLRQWLVDSDRTLDAQAMVLDPVVMYEAARRLVAAGDDDYARTLAMARYAVEVIDDAVAAGELALSARDDRWRGLTAAAIGDLPEDPAELAARLQPEYGGLFLAPEYDLGG